MYKRQSLTKVDPRFTSSKNLCGLKDGYIIKVLHSGNEFVLPEHRKFEWDILPTDMHHGYLSGIAHKENEPYIIYWVIAW